MSLHSAGDSVKMIFPVLDGDATLPATVVAVSGNVLRAQFDPLTLQEEEALTMVLYSRADTWLGLGRRARGRSAVQEPGPHLPVVDAWALANDTRFDEDEEKSPPKGNSPRASPSAAVGSCAGRHGNLMGQLQAIPQSAAAV